MELYIGGYAQGKLAYVQSLYQDLKVIDEKSFGEYLNGAQDEAVILNHLHLIVKEYGVEVVKDATLKNDHLIIISDEIGNGIVPIAQEERTYREAVGRLLIEIAAKADKVVRVVCSIAQQIK